jgi:transposase InsO family protein
VLGYDVVGEIDQLGDGVRGFQLGERVADLTVLGSNAAYRTLRASDLTRVPAGVDAAEAAALILSWTTAYQLLHRAARVQRGQRVLVQGAAGAVGQLVLGRLAGLELWGTARGAFLGIASSPAFAREPEGNGCVERFIRTLKENLLWVRRFDTIEELRQALQAFKDTYNRTWIVERHAYQTPAPDRRMRP